MARERIGKLAGFIGVAALPAGCNLLLTLVLVRALGVDRFAAWSIVEPTVLIFAVLAGFGMQYGLLFLTASDDVEPRVALGTAVTAVLPVALVGSTIAWLLMRGEIAGLGWFSVATAFAGEALAVLAVSSLRGQRRLGLWLVFEGIRSLGLLIVSAAMLVWSPRLVSTVDGFLVLRGLCTIAAVLLVLVAMRVRPVVDRELVKRMAAYGLPIAGAAVVQLFSNSADRYLLAALGQPAEAIAQYAAHQRLTGILNVLTVTPINLWFAVEAIRRDTERDAPFFRAVVLAVTAMLAVLMLGAIVGGPLIWPYLFPQIAFEPALYALLIASIVPQALGIVLNIGGLRERKTHLNFIVVLCSLAAAGVFGVALIPVAGEIGAGAARFVTLAVAALVGWRLSQRISPVHHRLRDVAPFFLAMALALAMLFNDPGGLAFWTWGAASLGVLGVALAAQAKLARLLRAPAPASSVPEPDPSTETAEDPDLAGRGAL